MRWVKQGVIFNISGNQSWSRSHAQVPVVDVFEDDRWRVYYATRDEQGRSRIAYFEIKKDRPDEIIQECTNPILNLGRLGTFDDSGMMPSCIIRQESDIYLYYIGWSIKQTVPFQNAIGLAKSADGGATFKRVFEGPIIGVDAVDPFFTGTCYVLKEKHGFLVYYLSCIGWKKVDNKQEPLYHLKIAKSTDGIQWKKTGKVAIELLDGEGGIASASVQKDQGIYRMWFSVRGASGYREGGSASYRICSAISQDGMSWSREEGIAVNASERGWDSKMTAYPYVLRDQDTLYMFYNGNGFGRTGIGLATSKINGSE